MRKKILSLVLSVSLVCSILSVGGWVPQVSAAQQDSTVKTVDASEKEEAEATPTPSPSPSASPSPSPSIAPSDAPATQEPTVKPIMNRVRIKSFESSKKRRLTLKWKKAKDVNGYQIEIGLGKEFKGKKNYTVKKANTIKKTFKKLKSKKKYFVRIRAYKTVSGNTYCGPWSKTKAIVK